MRKVINKAPNYSIDEHGIIINRTTAREMKINYTTKRGYPTICLSVDKKPKTFLVHRLVAEAFCEEYSDDLYVDHIDKCKTNFNSYNLRCVTAKENAANRGVDEKIIDAIIKLHESGMSREEIRYIVTY
jgi:hypothetical protein